MKFSAEAFSRKTAKTLPTRTVRIFSEKLAGEDKKIYLREYKRRMRKRSDKK